MSPGKLGIFANLALVASAMLIPPSMTAEELGDDVAMEGLVVNPFRRTITLDCPGCPFASLEGDSYQWTPDVGNTFVSTASYAAVYTAGHSLTCHSV